MTRCAQFTKNSINFIIHYISTLASRVIKFRMSDSILSAKRTLYIFQMWVSFAVRLQDKEREHIDWWRSSSHIHTNPMRTYDESMFARRSREIRDLMYRPGDKLEPCTRSSLSNSGMIEKNTLPARHMLKCVNSVESPRGDTDMDAYGRPVGIEGYGYERQYEPPALDMAAGGYEQDIERFGVE